MKKRIFSVILVLALMLSLMPAAFAASDGLANFKKTNSYTSGQFTDVIESKWYARNVQAAYELGLVQGNSATSFNPEGNISVAETLALACRLHSIYHNGSAEFTQGKPWYQVYVDYALGNNIITANQFDDYKAKATREQFATVLAAALPESALTAINNIALGDIPDIPADDFCAKPVYLLYNAGVLTGSDDYGSFNPSKYIKRSEVATIVTRMADVSMRKQFELSMTPLLSSMQGLWSSEIDLFNTYELMISGNEFLIYSINSSDYYYCSGTFSLCYSKATATGQAYLGYIVSDCYAYSEVLTSFETECINDGLTFFDMIFERTSSNDGYYRTIETLISNSSPAVIPLDVYLDLMNGLLGATDWLDWAIEELSESYDFYNYYLSYDDSRDLDDCKYYFEEMKLSVEYALQYLQYAIDICGSKPYLAHIKGDLVTVSNSYSRIAAMGFSAANLDLSIDINYDAYLLLGDILEEADNLLKQKGW